MSDHYQIQNVPKRNSNYCKSSISEGSGSLGRSIGIPSASSIASDISVLSLGSETLKNEVSGQKWAFSEGRSIEIPSASSIMLDHSAIKLY